MQIPLIFRHPDVIADDKTSDLLIDEFDLFPTLLDYLGLGNLDIANSPGRSFAPALTGKKIEWDNTVFFEYIDTRVIQTRNWKYTQRFLAAPNELYDLKRDPNETTNLLSDPEYELIVQDLAERLNEFFNVHADPQYDIWRGGTAKATLYYGGQNARFAEHFPDWQPPSVKKAQPFRDRVE